MKTMKVVFALVALLTARLASAEMLYWMIGDATSGGSNTIAFDYAVVYATKGDEKIALPNDGRGGETYWKENGDDVVLSTKTTGPNLTELGDWNYKDYSFYVELFNYDFSLDQGTSVGVSEWATYDALVSHGAIIPSGMGIPATAHIWMPATAVPEPTSLPLVLVGIALLLLKRRSLSAGNG